MIEEINNLHVDYKTDEDGNLYYIKHGKDGAAEITTLIANHTPIVKEIRQYYDGVTDEPLEIIILYAYRNGVKCSCTKTAYKDILGQTPQLCFGVQCVVYPERGNLSHYRNFILSQATKIKTTCSYYKHMGYIYVNKKHIYLNGEYSVTADGLTDKYNVDLENDLKAFKFLKDKPDDRYDTLLNILPDLTEHKIIYTCLAYTFLTPLNAILRESITEPRFILYLTGKTGSYKTATAKLFLNFFGVFNQSEAAPACFRDTPNAIEKKCALTDSALMLLDDRIPNTNKTENQRYEELEQAAARMIGDRKGRARLTNTSDTMPSPNPKCNLIITGEDVYKNITESGIARSICLELKKDLFNVDVLTELQEKANHLNACLSDYIEYIINNWDDLSKDLKNLFMEYRNKAQGKGHARLAESISHLQIGIYVLCKWLISVKKIEEEEAHKMQAKTWDIFIALSDEQKERIEEEDPVKMFIDALNDIISQKTYTIINLATTKNEPVNTSNMMGYEDKEYYYMYKNILYDSIVGYYEQLGRSFPLSDKKLFNLLGENKIIIPGKDQIAKVKCIFGKSKRILQINKNSLTWEVTGDGKT